MMNVGEMLDYAALRIETEGWWNGILGATTGLCPILALKSDRSGFEAHRELLNFLGLSTSRFTNILPIAVWKDSPGQTKENVVATMRACALTWRAKNIIPEKVPCKTLTLQRKFEVSDAQFKIAEANLTKS